MGYRVTQDPETGLHRTENGGLSLLPDPDLGLRVRKADLARMLGVTRTTVTRWHQAGIIQVSPDGLLDPRRAARQVLDHIDPARLRAKVLRPLVNDQRELRKQINELQHERDSLAAEVKRLRVANAMMVEDIELLNQYAPDNLRGSAADDPEDEDESVEEPSDDSDTDQGA